MVDGEIPSDGGREQLGAAEVDADHAVVGHDGGLYPRALVAQDQPDRERPEPREYTLYRSRPRGLRARLRGLEGLEELRRPRRERRPGEERPGGISGRRVLRWVALAVGAWLALSLVLFLVSAQIQRGKVSDAARTELGGGFPLTSKTTVLVLGSDQRPKDSKEPGARSGPARADSILLMRVGGGAGRRLSIPRDTVVDVPGHGRQKINAAYAFGGTSLMIRTVKSFLGVDIDHVVEVDFTNFPKFIDALGGVDVKTGCVRDLVNGGDRNGGVTINVRPGVHHFDGRRALALSRVRKNACRPGENDLDRARRQQQVLTAIKGRMLSVSTFLRLPLVSWSAPRAIRTDMGGFSLLGLAGGLAIGGSPPPRVLKPSGATTLPDGGQGLTVDPATVRAEVARFERG
jgi:LCP family protein required for cell wall assembly